MKKNYYRLVFILPAIITLIFDINVILFFATYRENMVVLFSIILIIHTVFLCSWYCYHHSQKVLENTIKDFYASQNFEEFRDTAEPYLSPQILSLIWHLRNEKLDFSDSQKQAEYLALQNQINPHFLYNTLEALRGDTLYEGLTSVASVIEALATFFRYTITDTGNLTTLENELEHTENYFLIQKYRFGDKIDMSICYPPDKGELLTFLIPKLTLQPIIENSIFHGLERKSGEGQITISLETTERFLFVNISDTGIGMPPERLHQINSSLQNLTSQQPHSHAESPAHDKEHKSIALYNVARRIRLLFGNDYGIHLYSTPDIGTDVQIILPKIQKRNLTL